MQATSHFYLFSQSGEDNIIQKCRASRFCCRASGFSSHLPCRTIAVGTIFEAWLYIHNESYKHKDASRQAEKVIRYVHCLTIVICFEEIPITKNASGIKKVIPNWKGQYPIG